jgi:hypothetical protein
MHAKSAAAMCAISTFFTLSPAFAEQPSPTPLTAMHAPSTESPGSPPAASPPAATNARAAQTSKDAEPKNGQRANAARAPRSASEADRNNYAARESASPEAKVYQGGDSVVVIGASTVTVILAVILLVVLI